MIKEQIQQQVQQAGTKVADIAAGTSLSGAGVSILADVNTYVQIGAGLVAILAGLAAAAFHVVKLYWAHQDRKKA
jgi:hypothetical protein